MEFTIQDVLINAKKQGASDVHLNIGIPPVFRLNGKLVKSQFPVLEKEDPYDPFDDGPCTQFSPQKHIQNVIFIPDRKDASDNQNIKQGGRHCP